MRKGNVGWAGLVAFVLGYDTWAIVAGRESMTAAFGRAIQHPFHRWPVSVAWAITTLHLFGRLPRWLDPFHAYARVLAFAYHKRLSSSECLPYLDCSVPYANIIT